MGERCKAGTNGFRRVADVDGIGDIWNSRPAREAVMSVLKDGTEYGAGGCANRRGRYRDGGHASLSTSKDVGGQLSGLQGSDVDWCCVQYWPCSKVRCGFGKIRREGDL